MELAWRGLVESTGILPPVDAAHGLAIGAIGSMTLAVMSGATLGHTGRPLHAAPLIVASYVSISAATLARLAAPPAPADLVPLLPLSGLFWALAFAAFAIRLGPVLLQPRAAGRPG